MANILMPRQTIASDRPVPFFERMDARRISGTQMSISPYNGTQQVYVQPRVTRIVDFTLPVLSESEAEDWIGFLNDLNGMENTFTVDVSFAFPYDPSAGVVSMRLLNPEQTWSIMQATKVRLTFTAIEAK